MQARRIFGSSMAVALWTVAWLLVIDVAVNAVFGSEAALGELSGLKRYFEYGRSVEGKLARMVVADPKKGGQILSAGWISEEIYRPLPSKPADGHDLLVAVYGQSFALNAAEEAARLDGKITIRSVGGPGAPPSHSYAAYKLDAPLRKADVVVLGLLSSTVPNMGSMSGLVWLFENPAPFTFPRYRLAGDQITEELPVLRSEAQFRDAFSRQPEVWRAFRQQLRTSDRGYDRLVFDASPADSSAIVRLLRRGWVAHQHAYEEGVYDPMQGFDPEAEDIRVLRAMVLDIARRTRERGERLVVLLSHSRGQSDHLYVALKDTLEQAGIPWVSSHTAFSTNDPSNFVADGHYTESANRLFAKALLEKLRGDRPPAAGAR